ncbi:response regulator [Anaerolineae bacterium CFX9]|jgi:DNA-binding response OmpR family regulator|nr:response regulator [Anaerolineae bacterium CFX9]
MTKGRILVVEDDADIANLLKTYFSGQGYEVQVAMRGGDALTMTRKQLPNLIVLDIMLPDMNGYDVCRQLRTTTRTSHIPIIFLTQKDERSDKIQGLELGADDYIVKPFDIEELKLRVQNAITAANRQTQIDSKSNLPTGRLIEDHLRTLMHANRAWTYFDLKVNEFDSFTDVYGFVAGDEVIRFMALLIGEVIDEVGTPDDYAGHPGRDNFVVISHAADPTPMRERLIERFDDEVRQHYSFIDRERGYILVPDPVYGERQVALMTLSIGSVSTRTNQFSDIREITELAAEDRRRGAAGLGDSGIDDNNSNILTSW